MTDLQSTLSALLDSRASNPAFDTLMHDYVVYHAVLAALGAVVTCALLAGSVVAWRRSRQARRRTFERSTLRTFAVSGALVTALLAVLVAANVSSAVSPRQGFANVIPELGASPEVTAWLREGRTAEVPPQLQAQVDERLSWQRPKAIICSLLALLGIAFSVRLWRRLLARERRWTGIAVGSGAVAASALLTLMAMANTQAVFAPLVLTLLNG